VATHTSGVRTTAASPGRVRCWLEGLILGLGVPAAIWVVSKLVSVSIPAADHGTPAQRFLLWVSHVMVAEWATIT